MSSNYSNYKELRAKGYTASTTLKIVRRKSFKDVFGVDFEGDSSIFDYQGFEISVRVDDDLSPPLRDMGKFSNRKGKDAIWHNRQNNNNIYDYFNPTNTVADYRESFHQLGYSKDNAERRAKQAIQEDYKAALTHDNVVITVTASLNNIKLGFDSLGYCDRDDVEQTILDYGMVNNAMEAAKTKLAELQTIRFDEDRVTLHNKGFSVHYYYSDIPTNELMVAEAACDALAQYADLHNSVCVEAIAQMTEQAAAELDAELMGRE